MMKVADTKLMPSPPSLVVSLTSGFDAVTRHIQLILFPVLLDLYLWLGPHLKVTRLAQSIQQGLQSFSGVDIPEATGMLKTSQEVWQYVGERLNLMASLRTYPVGIPSMMTSQLPIRVPGATQLVNIDIPSIWVVFLVLLGCILLGLIIGSVYFQFVSNVVVHDRMQWNSALKNWPWASLQVILLAFLMLLFLMAIFIPASCVISILSITLPTLGQMAILMFMGFLIWLLFPFLFSAHGIFVNRMTVLLSIKRGVQITRLTLPRSGLLFLIIFITSQLLDLVWNMSPEDSWFTLVGILVHGFVTTGFLAASFVFYTKADQWIQSVQSQAAAAPLGQLKD